TLRAGLLINVEWSLEHLPRKQRRNENAPSLLTRHFIGDVAGASGVKLRVRLLQRFGHYTDILYLIKLAIVGKFVLCESKLEDIDSFVVAWTAFFQREGGGAKEP